MLKIVLILAAIGCLAWFGIRELDLGGADRPVTPSVGYPNIGGGGAGDVGEETSSILSGP